MDVNKMFLKLIYKNIFVSKSRTLIMFLSIVVGSSIVCAFASIYFDINAKMSKELRTFGPNFFIGKKDTSKDKYISLEDYNKAIKNISKDKIVGATKLLYGMVRLDLANAVLTGIDFKEAKKINPFWQIEGSWISVDFDNKNCMIGKTLAKDLELKIGQSLLIRNEQTSFYQKVKIKGIIETGQAEDNQLFVNFDFASTILGIEDKLNYSMLSLLYDSDSIEKLAIDINSSNGNLIAKPIRKVSASEGKILNKIKSLMAIIAFMILVITTMSVSSTLIAAISQRAKEIGLQKALGAKNSDIIKQFLSENALVSFFAILAGVILGFILAQIMGQAIFASSIEIRWEVIPLTFLISFSSSMIAVSLPIKKVLKILPANVLRGE